MKLPTALISSELRAVELFAGAGGLALGVHQAGFRHEVMVERDKTACATLRANNTHAVWPLVEGDVRVYDFASVVPGISLLAGGPPCQPFSLGGKHQGYQDSRDLFPEAVRAVHALQPRAFLFENVRGLLRESFAHYFSYILLRLTYPDVMRRSDESWTDHRARLEQHHTGGVERGLTYRVMFQLLNAADYGVPQRRERVFIVGFRADQDVEWAFPTPTHSAAALYWSQWGTGEYWTRHDLERPTPPLATQPSLLPVQQPWRTVRDALADLPDPRQTAAAGIANHYYMPGARPYPGHTGSLLDQPAKTLKAGDHGVPGGENMFVTPDGDIRYFTVRESARLQTFPDDYVFCGSWSESMRQLGNAVPVTLSRIVAHSIAARLATTKGHAGNA